MKAQILRMPALLLLAALAVTGPSACSDSDTPQEQPAPAPTPDPAPDPDKATELNYTVAEAAYWGDDYMEDGVSNVILYLYDSPRNEEGAHVGPKDHFNIDMNLPNFEGGELLIPAGTYPIGEAEVYDPDTLEPGYLDEYDFGGMIYSDYYGVFRQVTDAEQEESYELITAGEMTVSCENGIYTIDATFESEEGKRYHVTYTGAIEVDDESLEYEAYAKHKSARK